jgi:hypothetical protein
MNVPTNYLRRKMGRMAKAENSTVWPKFIGIILRENGRRQLTEWVKRKGNKRHKIGENI